MGNIEGYNGSMRKITELSDAIRLIRVAALLWIGYLVLLAVINQTLGPPQNPDSTFYIYYLLYGLIALICLGLAYSTWIQQKLKRGFIPLIIVLSTVMPILLTWVMVSLFQMSPQSVADSLSQRLLPFLYVGLLLVAWQYRWPYILLVILLITVLSTAVMLSYASPGTLPFRGGLVTSLIQMVIFLTVAFSTSYLMNRIRRQQRSLEEANARLTHYASTLEHLSISQERNRLARELHDTLAHTLSGLSVQLETAKAYWEVDPQAARTILEKSSAAAHSGLEETRRALKSLRASPLDDLGLALAISALAEDAAARANLHLDLSVPEKMPPFAPGVEQCFYRVAQEALTNIVNHAQAKNITVKLEYLNEKIKLSIRDDGIGFNTSASIPSNHFGLVGMRERVQIVGGELNVVSRPGAGTLIELMA